MKKLMLTAAAAVLSMGAFALCGEADPISVVVVKPTLARQVYKFNYCGKTTKGVEGATIKNYCGEDGVGCIPRVPAKLKIKGWIAYCDSLCQSLKSGTGGSWAYAFWATKPYKGGIADAEVDFAAENFPHVIGKKPNKAEAFGTFKGKIEFTGAVLADGTQVQWDLGDGLYFAGLGKYKAPYYKKISGNFAGSPTASWYISNDVCENTDVYDCETLQLLCQEYPNTVAFGKWSVKYSKSASKKMAKGKLPKVPSYASQYVVSNDAAN